MALAWLAAPRAAAAQSWQTPAVEALLPHNYEELLEAFIQQRQRRPAPSDSPASGEE